MKEIWPLKTFFKSLMVNNLKLWMFPQQSIISHEKNSEQGKSILLIAFYGK